MVDVHPTAYTSPLTDQPRVAFRPAATLVNTADEDATVSGTFRFYRRSLGICVASLEAAPVTVNAYFGANLTTVDTFTPEEEVDSDYFVLLDTLAINPASGRYKASSLPPMFFDVIPAPPPPPPATLDDVVAAVQQSGQETTLQETVAKLPSDPATDTTLKEVSDKLPADPATETTLAKIESDLEAGIPVTVPDPLPISIADPVTVKATDPLPTSTQPATAYQTNGQSELGTDIRGLVFSSPTRSVLIQAGAENTGKVYVGPDTVTSAGEFALAVLNPGDSIVIDIDATIGHLFVIASAAGQQYCAGALYL